MDGTWTTSLVRRYEAVIDSLERALAECPDDLWETSLWEVRKQDPFVWPVRRAGSRATPDLPTQERLLQEHSAFWNLAYYAIFFGDFYLSRGVSKGFAPPPPFAAADHRGHVVPRRVYTRAELLAYASHTRQKARTTIGALTEAQAAKAVPRTGRPFADFLLGNLLHLQEHTAQLHLFLGQRATV